jgi:hypothetical protein
MIQGNAPDSFEDPHSVAVYQKAVDLYGLVHAQYIS